MGRVKSELMVDGPDDDLIAKPISQTVDNIRQCDLPTNSVERHEYLRTQLKELMNGIKTNTD